ncbi:PDZ domain-containing protein [Neolewinella aurantiaca]|uniref:PDZ domain-containing protein n=1 Tax=Neolewinella aurantiaca TaxID=2602767 RepID=A0A5C7FM09_9BACT|nr:aspartyl protease family protein [Neolewinella aurantiaca]TXF88429.1 PDZ domain-containing protein [Neolewinella aurantiaca]
MIILPILLFISQAAGLAQRTDLKILGKHKRIELPFFMENDFIVIEVLLDNIVPVRFIIDTGAENTILLEKKLTDMLNVDYRRTFQVRGSDVDNLLTAHLATGVDLRLADRLLARNRSILVLGENYFDFERLTGTSIQGILGADFLMRFTVEFDFRRQVVILHEPNDWDPSKRHVEVPAEFVRNRPYLHIPVSVTGTDSSPRRLLLDSGAGLTLLMHTFGDSTDVDLPQLTVPTYIANGLGGNLQGSVGRARKIALADKQLENVITYFQPLDTIGLRYLNGREGIIGNQILRRFNVVINYNFQKVWLQPEGSRWRNKFQFDRSGLTVLAGGHNLRTYTVASVVPGSPADLAGLQVRDRIVAVNGKSVGFMTLSGILKKLVGKPGKRVKIRYARAGEYQVVRFKLRDLI